MSQLITNAFITYLRDCLADEQFVVLDEFVLANVPGLDPDSPIDPAGGLPPASQIVHRQDVDQRGRIHNNAVAYSIVMDTSIGDFDFNAMYLLNKASGLVAMTVHKWLEKKVASDSATGKTGNSLVKTILMEYHRASEVTATHVDASTWQIDYAARLRGMDNDLRLQALQFLGAATFYGNAFGLVKEGSIYRVQPGVAYVGGLRAQLDEAKRVNPGPGPAGMWLDIYRAGSLLDAWVNHFTLTFSDTPLHDYVDSNGYQHFVALVANVNADGSIADERRQRTITLTGDVSGQAEWQDAQGATITVEVKDDSHKHSFGTIDGLASALASKSPVGHTHSPSESGAAPVVHGHAVSDVWGLQDDLNGKSNIGHTHTPNESGAAPSQHGHSWGEISDKPDTATRWPGWTEVSGKPDLAAANHTHPPGQVGAVMTHAGSGGGGSSVSVNVTGKTFGIIYVAGRGRWFPVSFAVAAAGYGAHILNRGGENADRDHDLLVNMSLSANTLTFSRGGSASGLGDVYLM
ncbi:hypothetical protein D6R50_12935 [Aeromonas veronii]|uniref:Phage tail fibre protein N-terminal domain-containing protein n=1 Tax=Aeromonas veronii TaxID=654 RepID=A0A3A9ILL8_AERVE|nr:phage tail protein [Aeromonas veronii]RKJ90099.1 hypothetical protein D6R50_12935 [Aeromonas veronii]